MTMTMYIVMNMNIYITKDNEDYLKSLDRSMSGLVNELLYIHRSEQPSSAEKKAPAPDKKLEAFSELKESLGVKLCPHGAAPELCKHATVRNGKRVCK